MRFFVITILLVFSITSFSQNYPTGTPYIKNFSSLDYGYENQNWTVACDNKGILYFGNNGGVLQFDGVHWSLIELSNKSVVRSLGYGTDDVMYVGGNNDFGYLSADSIGKSIFVSLLNKLPEDQRSFGDVWRILTTADSTVYFMGNQFVFVYRKGYFKRIKNFSDNSSFYFIIEDTLLGTISS
ncbi:MAG: hypothetical protein J7L46_02865, partial [Bacteroidales bacterium]|nr:hypothetical protein [Bacteroidales bacterium]